MSYTLLVTEKPSVAMAIAKVLNVKKRQNGYLEGNGYLITWCVGHLVELASADAYDEKYAKWKLENLPIIPDKWQFVVSKSTKKQFDIVKKLMHRSDVDKVVNCCDAGREGCSIFRNTYHMAGCKKPVLRLWISSMEDKAIRDGMDYLRPASDYDHLYESALARSEADWLVGINGTRLFTALYRDLHRVGRVQTPVLAMLVNRQEEIQNFVKKPYWNVHLTTADPQITFIKDKIDTKAEADTVLARCQGKPIEILQVKTEKKTTAPPKLYDLTLLQRDANRLYGYTAQQVLNSLQSLYEKKLCTYPRTDSNYLTEDMEQSTCELISICASLLPEVTGLPAIPDVKHCINNAKVSDHHAVLPTREIQSADLSALSEREGNILRQLMLRLLSATAEKHVYKDTLITAVCEGEDFTAKGRTILEQGWKQIEKPLPSDNKQEPEVLPLIREGDYFNSCTATISEHYTQPPKSYTEDSILAAMENAGKKEFDANTEKKGLGTPATRAGILEKLVKSGYVERKGKNLIPTEAGIHLISVVPDTLKSASLTAEWENDLMQIEHGKLTADEFMKGISGMVSGLVACYQNKSSQ